MSDEVSVHVDARPEAVYALIADIPRMGEWSPECYRTEWLAGNSEARRGARFKGYNRYRRVKWSTVVEIETADPGRELTFAVLGSGKKRTRWSYRFAPAGSGTDVTETRETVAEYGWPIRTIVAATMPRHEGWMKENMRQTLERIKAAAEKNAVTV
jgi:polyketide cyclase/dehydrase/lipid transport protein